MEDDRVAIVFIPALAALLLHAERLKGAPLTEREVVRIRDEAICMTVSHEAAAKLEVERGYRDIDPECCWQEWQQLRPRLVSGRST